MRISSLCSKRISVLPRLRLFLKTHSIGAIAVPILIALAVQALRKPGDGHRRLALPVNLGETGPDAASALLMLSTYIGPPP